MQPYFEDSNFVQPLKGWEQSGLRTRDLLCSRKVCFENIFHLIFCLIIILVLEISLCNFRNIVVACCCLLMNLTDMIFLWSLSIKIMLSSVIGNPSVLLYRFYLGLFPNNFFVGERHLAINITGEKNLWERYLRRAIEEARECCIIQPVCYYSMIHPVYYCWKIIGSHIVICTLGGGLKETVQK